MNFGAEFSIWLNRGYKNTGTPVDMGQLSLETYGGFTDFSLHR